MMVIVDMRRMTKSYRMGQGYVKALDGVDLQILSGEYLAIMGPSGSGKSTLLHLLGCLDRPTSGQYFIEGRDISLLNDQALSAIRSTKIGFVFQSFNLLPQFSVLENVELPFAYQKQKKLEDFRDVSLDAIEQVGLTHRLHHLPSELSGGEMQRVAIARALVIDPLLILADEPTGNLDSGTSEAILDMFEELNQRGVTLVVITHDEAVGSRSSRIIRMCDGKVAG